jgi:hypothetical protein
MSWGLIGKARRRTSEFGRRAVTRDRSAVGAGVMSSLQSPCPSSRRSGMVTRSSPLNLSPGNHQLELYSARPAAAIARHLT